MRLELENAQAYKTQRTYARLAGFLFLWEIILILGSGFILSRVAGTGSFAEISKRIAASEHLYRAALSTVVMVTFSSAVLAFALYATLKPVNPLLAQLGMIFWLGDSFVGMVVRMCDFVKVHFYISAQMAGAVTVNAEQWVNLMRSIASATENIGGIAFGIGSFIFFYLFFKSRYIPIFLSVLGVGASVLWTVMYFANLVFPEQHTVFQYICFPPMALADVISGVYLLLFGVKTEVST